MKEWRRWIDFVQYPLVVVLAVLYGPRGGLWTVGMCLSAITAGAWGLARWQLGRSFTVEPQARRLVTHGLYARIRHPVYLFGDLAYLGALLALQVWPLLLVWLVMAVEDVRRARREERVLEQAFGEEYRAHRRKTWF